LLQLFHNTRTFLQFWWKQLRFPTCTKLSLINKLVRAVSRHRTAACFRNNLLCVHIFPSETQLTYYLVLLLHEYTFRPYTTTFKAFLHCQNCSAVY
jgi:hypothetical protein